MNLRLIFLSGFFNISNALAAPSRAKLSLAEPPMLENLNNFSSIVVSTIAMLVTLAGIIAWMIRLESKVNHLAEDHTETKNNHDSRIKETDLSFRGGDEKVWQALTNLQTTVNQVLMSIGRLEGRLESRDHRNPG